MGVTSGADGASMPTYLAKRGSTYYFRRVVPDELRSVVGKTEFVWSLRTKDLATAKRLLHQDAVKTDAEIKRAEEVLAQLPSPEEHGLYDGRQSALAQMHDTIEVRQYAAVIAAAFRKELDKAATEKRLEARRNDLEAELTKHEWNLRDGSMTDRFSLSTSESMVLGLRALLTGDGAASLPPVEPPVITPSKAVHGDELKLSGLVQLWAKGKQPTAKSVDMWNRSVSIFVDVCGDIPVANITKKNVIAFKDHLLASGRKSSTVQNRINQLRSLFKYAVGQDFISADPSEGVQPPPDKSDDKERHPWTTEALNTLFAAPIHAEGTHMLGGGEAAGYLLPLLGLFTGARQNELGQLRPKDVFEEMYVDEQGVRKSAWVMQFVRDKADGLKLKNKASIRRIPVHDELIRLGFLDLVKRAKEQNQMRIFADLSPDKYGTVTANWGKWFGRYIRTTCGISDVKITYHSFRHSFKDTCRALDLSEPIQDAITGHSDGREARKYGYMSYPLGPMVSLMKRYKVHGVVLPAPYRIR